MTLKQKDWKVLKLPRVIKILETYPVFKPKPEPNRQEWLKANPDKSVDEVYAPLRDKVKEENRKGERVEVEFQQRCHTLAVRFNGLMLKAEKAGDAKKEKFYYACLMQIEYYRKLRDRKQYNQTASLRRTKFMQAVYTKLRRSRMGLLRLIAKKTEQIKNGYKGAYKEEAQAILIDRIKDIQALAKGAIALSEDKSENEVVKDIREDKTFNVPDLPLPKWTNIPYPKEWDKWLKLAR
jgi:hypothetical protein